MQTAASTGRRVLVDRQTKTVVWIEGHGNHVVPLSRYPHAMLVTVHERVTAGRDWAIGDTYPEPGSAA